MILLCSPVSLALCVHILRIKVNSGLPLNCIEGDPDSLKSAVVLDSLKNAEIENLPHVQSAALPIVKDNRKLVIVTWNNLYN